VKPSSIRPGRSLGVPAAARAALAAASRPKSKLAVLVAALLLTLTAASSADAAGGSVYWGNPIGSDNSIGTTIGHANDDGTGVNPSFIGGASEPTGVAVDEAHVYWINDLDHSIGRANLDGTGVNQRFVTGVNGDALAVDGAHIYWTNIIAIAPQDAADDAIGRANLDGTGVDQNFITGASTPQGVAVDRAHVYWTNSDRHAIGRANLDGTGVKQNFTDVCFGRLPVGVAVDGAHIYWANINADTIGRANLDGTAVNQNFIEGAAVPFGVAVDSAHLYWTNQFPSPDGTTGGTIARANVDGTDVNQTFIAGFTGDPIGVAVTPSAQTEQAARISINDVTIAEGNAGQTAFRFTASLDAPQPAPVTVDFATGDGTATAPSDYAAGSGSVTFASGEVVKTVTVQVNGDTTVEANETLNLNLANATGNATIADAQSVATIVDDDQAVIEPPARISLGDVTMSEGNARPTAFRFTASLDRPQSGPVTVDFTTGPGTATAPSDYAANAGTLSFAPGDTSETVTVQVNGDATVEANEAFNLSLANATGNATIADGQAAGTILNDDRKAKPHTFTLGKPRLNPKRGTARLAVTVSAPGKLAISGNGAKPVARSLSAAGTVQLLIKASGTQKRRLSRTGTVTVRPRVTYTPIGGRPITRSTNVRLKKL
jgi:virginiamycin B lyase